MLLFFFIIFNKAYIHLDRLAYPHLMRERTRVMGKLKTRDLFGLFNSSTVIEFIDIIENEDGPIMSVRYDSCFKCTGWRLYGYGSWRKRNNALFESNGNVEICEFDVKNECNTQ